MPVVEKITKLNPENGKVWFEFEISRAHCRIYSNANYGVRNNGSTTLEATYKTVVEFVKWYSQVVPPLTKTMKQDMKTLKKVPLELIKVEFIPEVDKMEFGKIYYSEEYNISNHLCPCGCGTQTPLPIKEGEWFLVMAADKPSITPSIQHKFNCRSHYVITNGIANMLNEPVPKHLWDGVAFDHSQPGE